MLERREGRQRTACGRYDLRLFPPTGVARSFGVALLDVGRRLDSKGKYLSDCCRATTARGYCGGCDNSSCRSSDLRCVPRPALCDSSAFLEEWPNLANMICPERRRLVAGRPNFPSIARCFYQAMHLQLPVIIPFVLALHSCTSHSASSDDHLTLCAESTHPLILASLTSKSPKSACQDIHS